MIWKHIRVALFVGALAVTAAVSARAEDEPKVAPKDAAPKVAPQEAPKDAPKPMPVEAAKPAPAAAPTCTVCVKEWVAVPFTCTRTTYTVECKQEKYTAFKCECVPETRTIKVCVPTWEEKEVMQTVTSCKPVQKTVKKCVDKGHFECKEVPCGPTCRERLQKLCNRNKCACGCTPACGSCCGCEPCCPPKTKTVKCWVPNIVTEDVTVTCYERICEQKPVKVKVCVHKTVDQTCTVNVLKKVPCEAVRTVRVCVPHQETITGTRMECRTVQKQVPCAPCTPVCETTCCKAPTCCKTHCHTCPRDTCCKTHCHTSTCGCKTHCHTSTCGSCTRGHWLGTLCGAQGCTTCQSCN